MKKTSGALPCPSLDELAPSSRPILVKVEPYNKSGARDGRKVIPLPGAASHPVANPSDAKKGPQLGTFGVLVVVMDQVASARSADMLARYASGWQGREVVFLSAASARVGKQVTALFPKLFYNTGEPLALHTVWRLLPWRAVVVIKAGKVCCWSPPTTPSGSKTQTPTPNESK